MNDSPPCEDYSSSQETINLLPRHEKSIDEHGYSAALKRKPLRLEKMVIYSIFTILIVSVNVFLALKISPFLGSKLESSVINAVVNPVGMSKGITHDHGQETEENGYMDCGNVDSLESKFAHNCVFDLYQPGWIPTMCSNDELREEFSKLPEFDWYLDEARTKKIPETSLKEHWNFGSKVYSDPEYHVYHCAYTMRAMTSSLVNTTRCFPKKFLDHKHTEHCIRVLEGNEANLVNEVHFGKDVECYVRYH